MAHRKQLIRLPCVILQLFFYLLPFAFNVMQEAGADVAVPDCMHQLEEVACETYNATCVCPMVATLLQQDADCYCQYAALNSRQDVEGMLSTLMACELHLPSQVLACLLTGSTPDSHHQATPPPIIPSPIQSPSTSVPSVDPSPNVTTNPNVTNPSPSSNPIVDPNSTSSSNSNNSQVISSSISEKPHNLKTNMSPLDASPYYSIMISTFVMTLFFV